MRELHRQLSELTLGCSIKLEEKHLTLLSSDDASASQADYKAMSFRAVFHRQY